VTDPYQNNPGYGAPQYGPPGTGPDLNKPQGQPYGQQSDPYAQQQPFAQQQPYGQPPAGYGQPPAGYGQPGGYPPPGPQGYNPNDPEAPYGRDPFGVPYSDKQKMVAGLLGIFAGSFGIGRFYLGHTGIAIAQIAVTWLTCGLGVIWPIIDGVMILTGKVPDAQGRPLRD